MLPNRVGRPELSDAKKLPRDERKPTIMQKREETQVFLPGTMSHHQALSSLFFRSLSSSVRGMIKPEELRYFWKI